MSKTTPRTTGERFDYCRDKDGCDDFYYIVDQEGRTRASIQFWDEPDTDHAAKALALARLLAAAPSMLEALERFESAWRNRTKSSSLAERAEMARVYQAACDAIALARTG